MVKVVHVIILSMLLSQVFLLPSTLFAQDETKSNLLNYLTPEERGWVDKVKNNLAELRGDVTYQIFLLQNISNQPAAEWAEAYRKSTWDLYEERSLYEGASPSRPASLQNIGLQSSTSEARKTSLAQKIVQVNLDKQSLTSPEILQAAAQEESALQALLQQINNDEAALNAQIIAIASPRQQQEAKLQQAKDNKFLELVDKIVKRVLWFLYNKDSRLSTDEDKIKDSAVNSQGAASSPEIDKTYLKNIRYCRIMYNVHALWSSGNQYDGYAGQEEWAYVEGSFNGLVYTGERVYTYPNSTLPIKMKYQVTLHRDSTGEIQSTDFEYYRETTDAYKDPPRGPDDIIKLYGKNVLRRQDRESTGTLYFRLEGNDAVLDPASTARSAAWNPNAACCWSTKWSANKNSFLQVELSPAIPKPR